MGFAQTQDCSKLLEGGLYSFTKMTNTGSFNEDLRTYYLSEQFQKDMESGKWGSSATIPIEGVPWTFTMNFSKDKYKEFKSRLLSMKDLKISEEYYQTSYSTIPNTNLYDVYLGCVTSNNDVSKTGFIQGSNIETEDVVVFVIYYRPQAPGDMAPKVLEFNVQPEGSVLSGAPKVGDLLSSYSLLVTCKRDQERDLVLTLRTDRAHYSSKSVADGSISSSKEFPLGTIITSVLDFKQFSSTSKNNEKSASGDWTSRKSKWAPCDGRPIPYSKYSILASQTNAPDLRGVFLRGLNSFDSSYTIQPTDTSQLNPDKTPAGIYQKDLVGHHSHLVEPSGTVVVRGGNILAGNGGPAFSDGTVTIKENEGNETRPKNVSIYYYIKIN